MPLAPIRISEFDVWRQGYAGATVEVRKAGTTALATVYSDYTLTTPVDNPITLESRTLADKTYGKFSAPLYVAVPYQLHIDSTDTTGIVNPKLTSLQDEPAGYATSQTKRSSRQRRILDRFDDVIHVEDFGEIGTTPATNTATLAAAIGAAAGDGGGVVKLPAGTIQITTVSLSQGVEIEGQGRDATTLLSTEGSAVVTLAGDRSGLKRLTLDGQDLTPSSIGVDTLGVDEIVFDDVEIKRFNTGLRMKGGRRAHWVDFSIANCAKGADLQGESDTGDTGNGDQFRDNRWTGGRVRQCTTFGVSLSFEDQKVESNVFASVGFESNTGTALLINGARHTTLDQCWFSGNTTNYDIDDDDDSSQSADNTVIGFQVRGGWMNGGAINIDDTAQDIVFRDVNFADVDWTLNLPDNAILLINPIEDNQVTVSGDTEKLLRLRESEEAAIVGVTTDATATPAWTYTLDPGEAVLAEAKVVANALNGEDFAVYHMSVGARREGSELAYDNQTANFTLGDTLTGATSGATAVIVADADSGATGTLTLRKIVGEFQNNEIITDASGGSAQANGTLTAQNTALDATGVTTHHTYEVDTNFACTFTVSGGDLRVSVTGASGHTVEWTVDVDLVAG